MLTLSETHVLGSRTAERSAVRPERPRRSHADPRAALNPASLGIGNGVDRPIGMPQIQRGRRAQLRRSRHNTRRAVPTPRISSPIRCSSPAAGTLIKTRRRVPAFPQRELRGRHGRLQLSQRRRVPCRNRECVQHHAGRAPEPHQSASAVGLRARQCEHPSEPHRRARPALRMARHAHRAGQPVRGLRLRQRVAPACRRRSRRDLSAEQPERRATRGCRVGRVSGWPHRRARGLRLDRRSSRARRR